MKKIKIAWFSGGITSAVACKIALNDFNEQNNVNIFYIETGSHHTDSMRFLSDCEKWFDQKIEIFQSKKYKNHFDVIEKTRYINGDKGARCSKELKKNVRLQIEKEFDIENQFFGFDCSSEREINRSIRFKEQYPYTKPIFPLIERNLTKNMCKGIIDRVGIEIPEMYKLGYGNNNCIGCVKGGAGYWNKIKIDFPSHFKKMVEFENNINHSCLKLDGKSVFLKDLKSNRGNKPDSITDECGLFCDIDFVDIIDKKAIELFNRGRK